MSYTLRGSLEGDGQDSIPAQIFPTERQALIKAAELFDEYGSRALLEIRWNDILPALHNAKWMAKWNLNGRRIFPEAANR